MVVRVRSVRWALLGVCLGLTALSFWTVDRLASTRSADSFEAITADSLSALGERLKTYRQALDGLTGLFAASDRVTRPDIQRYVEALDIASNLPGATGLGYIAAVDRADWPAFAAEAEPVLFAQLIWWLVHSRAVGKTAAEEQPVLQQAQMLLNRHPSPLREAQLYFFIF